MTTNLKTKWEKARKRPEVVEFREVVPNREVVDMIKGTTKRIEVIITPRGKIQGSQGKDFVVRDNQGELQILSKNHFYKTYEVIE